MSKYCVHISFNASPESLRIDAVDMNHAVSLVDSIDRSIEQGEATLMYNTITGGKGLLRVSNINFAVVQRI